MIRVLFVDDEPHLLDGLKRVLRKMRGQWDMKFVESGAAALAEMEQSQYDVVVTDMRMPHMNGAELLREVIKRDSSIVRIVLSGQSEQECILESLGTTHQFFSKPCDIDELIHTISRACSLRDLFKSSRLQAVISKLSSLPSLPRSYAAANDILESENLMASEITDIVNHDPAMAAKVLQIANSAFFGARRNVSSIEAAVNLLGLDLIRSFVLAAGIFSQFDDLQVETFSITELFEHSVRVGEYAKRIAVDLNLGFEVRESCFAAGLLHDIGKLVVIREMADEAHAALKKAQEEGLPFDVAETELYQVNHAEIGAFLLGLWGLPDPIVESVAYHHDPMKSFDQSPSLLSAVYFGNMLDHLLHSPNGYQHGISRCEEYLAHLGLPKNSLEQWKEVCTADENEMGGLF